MVFGLYKWMSLNKRQTNGDDIREWNMLVSLIKKKIEKVKEKI